MSAARQSRYGPVSPGGNTVDFVMVPAVSRSTSRGRVASVIPVSHNTQSRNVQTSLVSQLSAGTSGLKKRGLTSRHGEGTFRRHEQRPVEHKSQPSS